MKQLTQEQIKFLEGVFASYPEEYTPTKNGIYDSMDGINHQLEKINNADTTSIFYVSKVKTKVMDSGEILFHFSIEKMKVEG